jgi:hypothetical protein
MERQHEEFLHILAILLNFKQYFRATLEELYQNTTF